MSDVSDEDIDWFWGVIERAHQSRDALRAILSEFSKEEIYRFQDAFVEMAVELQDEPYAIHVNPDESEDGVADIANWVVSQGREAYHDVLDNPDRMPPHVDVGDETILFPVAYEVYYERFEEPLEVM